MGSLVAAVVGAALFTVGMVQWYEPKVHYLAILSSLAVSEGEDPAMNSLVRALAVVAMYGSGFFFVLAWHPVLTRLHAIFVHLLAG